MQGRRSSRVGMIVLGVLMGVGYIRQRDNGGSLLASVVGDYQSQVGYQITDQTLTISGLRGGESSLDVIVFYDSQEVSLSSVDSLYQYVIEDDGESLVRVQLHQLPVDRDQTGLVTMTWSGSMGHIVVSDIGVRAEDGVFHTLSVEAEDLCFGTGCYHE